MYNYCKTLLTFLFILIKVFNGQGQVSLAELYSIPFATPFQLALTPFTNPPPVVSIEHIYKCDHGSVIDTITLNKSLPLPVTCNGFNFLTAPIEYTAIIQGEEVSVDFTNYSVNFAFFNGNIFEYNVGQVTSGPCTNDFLSNFCVYFADDQFGCTSSKGVDSWSFQHCFKQISGPKCASICHLEIGSVTVSRSFSNSG